MFNLHQLLENLSMTGWILVLLGLIVWTAATYLLGEFSEKKWGDRESGALIGFFVPGLLFAAALYIF